MPDGARGALRAAPELAVGDDARADARRDLDEEHVGDRGPRGAVLAQRHDVHVVVDEHGGVEPLLQDPGDVDVVPRGHDRRVDGPPGGVLDGAGEADADADQVVDAAPRGRDELLAGVRDPRQDDVGTVRDREGRVGLGEHVGREVRDGEAGVGRAEVHGEHDARLRAEGEGHGRAPAGRAGLARGGDEAGRHEEVDPGGDGRPRLSRDRCEVRTGARLTVPEQLEHVAGTGRARRELQQFLHGHSESRSLSSVVRTRRTSHRLLLDDRQKVPYCPLPRRHGRRRKVWRSDDGPPVRATTAPRAPPGPRSHVEFSASLLVQGLPDPTASAAPRDTPGTAGAFPSGDQGAHTFVGHGVVTVAKDDNLMIDARQKVR